MAKKKQEISVFDTKAYKANLLKNAKVQEYNKKHLTPIKKVEKNIYIVTNNNAKTNSYIFKYGAKNKIHKTFNTLEKARKFKNIYFDENNIKINTKKKISTKEKTKQIERSVYEVTSIYGELRYVCYINVGGTRIYTTFKTIEEARKCRDRLKKKQLLILRLKKKENDIVSQSISRYISKKTNIKTNNTRYHFKIDNKKYNKINKSFKILQEAETFRDNYIKEQQCTK